MFKFILITIAALAVGCTDASISSFTSMGSAHHVTCYSGSKQIYEGYSTGRVTSPESSDGWRFVEKGGRLIEVSGNCVIVVL